VVMDQLILFHKPNKKVSSEKKINHFILQTKHTISDPAAHLRFSMLEIDSFLIRLAMHLVYSF
jgi:hypothetical protein